MPQFGEGVADAGYDQPMIVYILIRVTPDRILDPEVWATVEEAEARKSTILAGAEVAGMPITVALFQCTVQSTVPTERQETL